MRAVRFEAYGSTPQLIETDAPRCPADGVVVQVRATGLCRSDWHAWMGHETVPLPHIPGHEFAGVIAAVGDEVRGWSVGERVTAPFVLGCGVCEHCRAGDAQVCPDQRQPGFTGPGSFAELVAVERADTNLVALPASLDFVAAASLGCRFATAYRALTVHGNVAAGQWVAVHGCGGVGLSTVMIAVALGALVVAVDASTDALARAASLGATHLIDSTAHADTAAAVVDATGSGAHVSVDAIGDAQTAAASVRSLRRRGRHVQVGLLHGEHAMTALPMDLVIAHELQVHGSHGMAAHEYPAMLEMVASGALRPERLVGSVIGLDGAIDALTSMDRNTGGGMTVITP
ncbi:MAG TPA: zinc-dependent alcohol dehydrogenase family protein [Candidatus Dormibacteraeota bacterium]|nr:zinc-dependent alcohol dehydrogenase family protein [Candidatus Dormibacteraeota bacterium]